MLLDIGRGAVAVIAGYAAMVVLVIISSVLLAAFFPGESAEAPTQAYIVGNLICGFIAAMIGGWITASVAAQRPLLHASVLVAAIVGIGVFTMTSEPRPGEPAWYPAVIVAIGAAGAFLGGLLRAMKVERVHV